MTAEIYDANFRDFGQLAGDRVMGLQDRLKEIKPLDDHPRWDIWYLHRKISEIIKAVNDLIKRANLGA